MVISENMMVEVGRVMARDGGERVMMGSMQTDK